MPCWNWNQQTDTKLPVKYDKRNIATLSNICTVVILKYLFKIRSRNINLNLNIDISNIHTSRHDISRVKLLVGIFIRSIQVQSFRSVFGHANYENKCVCYYSGIFFRCYKPTTWTNTGNV